VSGQARGSLTVTGLGPGAAEHLTPAVVQALAQATDLIGYGPYVERFASPGTIVTKARTHTSDNGDELTRARLALTLASGGARAVVVSSGDPGVFAMAAAVFEAVEYGPPAWRALDIQVLPGITAMLAAAARVGAPLGHDFCAINLSDNLKPWSLIERRLRLAVEGDFAIALYNPRSKARPVGFARAIALLRDTCEPTRLLVFARAIATPSEHVRIVPLAEAETEMADMRTLVIVGSSATRCIERPATPPFVYTPRSAQT